MLISVVQQSDSVIHIYIFLYVFFSVMIYDRILNMVLYSRILLLVHPVYTSLHLLVPNSQSIPSSLPLSPSATASLFSLCVSLKLLIS